MPNIEPQGEVPGVSISGSQGVQVGSGNTMYSNWAPKPPLDPAVVGALNPHVAVAQLQQVSHEELVNFFARASPDDVCEILDTFFYSDLPKLATALADINRRKARELISGTIGTNIIDDLPEAAEAITREAARLGWADAGTLDVFTKGYARKYNNGHVFWSKRFGTRTTVGAIDDWVEDDEENITWGFPVGDQETAPISPFGTEGIRKNSNWARSTHPSTVFSV